MIGPIGMNDRADTSRALSVELVLDLGLELGECPVWDDRSSTLLFVDILAGRIHRWRRGGTAIETRDTPSHVGAVAPRAGGGFVVALQDGCGVADAWDADIRTLATFARGDRTRANDGKVDPGGRFLVGTMAYDAVSPLGSLYRLDPDGALTVLRSGVTISNGLGWTVDGATFYYADTPTGRVDRMRYDVATGQPGPAETFVELRPGVGSPDGLCVDVEGGVWVALWGGSAVHRYDAAGRVDAVIDLPVSQVTSCAFGGPALDELYITTARVGLEAATLAREPLAGGIFRARPGVRGVPVGPFRG
jgi:sugar lactone lactonase YvrE